MNNAIESFFDAWGMEDGPARAAVIARTFATNGTYADPRSGGALSGPDSIASYIDMFSANAPGWSVCVVKTDEITGLFRCTVAFGGPGPDGDMVQHGQYFVEMNGDLIARMIGFVGTGTPE